MLHGSGVVFPILLLYTSSFALFGTGTPYHSNAYILGGASSSLCTAPESVVVNHVKNYVLSTLQR